MLIAPLSGYNSAMPTILVIDDNPSVATALEMLFSLHDIDYSTGTMAYDRRPKPMADGGLADHLDVARRILDDAVAHPPDPLPVAATTADFETLRWFPYPGE